MAQFAVFAAVLACFGAAFAVPTSALRARRIAERDASVLGASVLVLGLGGMNLASAAASAVNGDVTSAALLFSVAPVASGLLGLYAVRRRLAGAGRTAVLAGAAALVIAGIPGYFAPIVAALAAAVAAGLFLFGLLSDPRALLRKLDPRL